MVEKITSAEALYAEIEKAKLVSADDNTWWPRRHKRLLKPNFAGRR